jgi:hypothetical protein
VLIYTAFVRFCYAESQQCLGRQLELACDERMKNEMQRVEEEWMFQILLKIRKALRWTPKSLDANPLELLVYDSLHNLLYIQV